MRFASRTLTKAETGYSHLDKEALAIIFAVNKCHQYLYKRRFEIKTDHKPLIYIFSEDKGVPAMASSHIQVGPHTRVPTTTASATSRESQASRTGSSSGAPVHHTHLECSSKEMDRHHSLQGQVVGGRRVARATPGY